VILKATLEDAKELEALINSGYRGEVSKQGWTTEADILGGIRTNEDDIISIINKPNGQLLKYVNDEGKIIGCVLLEEQDDALYLGMLCVSPSLQGGGVGKSLLYKGSEVAEDLGLKKVKMTVISVRHELIAWYERHGFVKTGQTKPFEGDGLFGEPVMPLEFVVMEKKLLD
jgi:ribosomal protein S18 acetylase RimI-like enzyme